MDDISSAVSKLLQDGQAMSYIQELLSSTDSDSSKNTNSKKSGENTTGLDFGAISTATQLFSGSGSSECEKLIEALVPFLSDKRKKKATDAKRILKILALLPILKESGILDNFLGGNNE